MPMISAVSPGKRLWKRARICACIEITSSALPRCVASTICLAALLALMEVMGSVSIKVNQVYSAWCLSPFMIVLTCEPVRISPGLTVVTLMPSFASSARSPSENPVTANFALA